MDEWKDEIRIEKNGNEDNEAKIKKKRNTDAEREIMDVTRKGEVEKLFDGWTEEQKEEGRKEGREGEREKQLTSCPSPYAARTSPWGDSDFKPLPCFIFPWLLQPDQSS